MFAPGATAAALAPDVPAPSVMPGAIANASLKGFSFRYAATDEQVGGPFQVNGDKDGGVGGI